MDGKICHWTRLDRITWRMGRQKLFFLVINAAQPSKHMPSMWCVNTKNIGKCPVIRDLVFFFKSVKAQTVFPQGFCEEKIRASKHDMEVCQWKLCRVWGDFKAHNKSLIYHGYLFTFRVWPKEKNLNYSISISHSYKQKIMRF
jgi:hypothetical protein